MAKPRATYEQDDSEVPPQEEDKPRIGLHRILGRAVRNWLFDDAIGHAAKVAFYTLFSMAPLLVIAVFLAGLFFGQGEARQTVLGRVDQALGPEAREMVSAAMEQTRQPGRGWAVAMSIVVFTFGATAMLGALQGGLNAVWDIESQGRNAVIDFLRKRLLTFVLVLVIGALLLTMVILSTVLTGLASYAGDQLPGGGFIWPLLNELVTLGLAVLLFAVVYKVLPDAVIAWRDVWIGATVTALLFVIGTFLIGLYLTRSAVSSTYGAAGALAVILFWVYYSAMIFFFGAEFTQAYAHARGRRIEPEKHAVRTADIRLREFQQLQKSQKPKAAT